jgi:peptidoglycan/LPS O-acetylase OafA/YrhL
VRAEPAHGAAPPALSYRPSLDGVRAIAVLLVLLFHFQVPGFPGGFIGVDVFFVLSGLLITTNLLAEHDQRGRVGLRAFYARRALRLLPALYLLLLCCAPFVAPEWTAAGFSYLANWFLATRTLQISPLSHLWSLSIEEQFYVVWPLGLAALLGAGRSRGAIAGVALALAVVSALAKVVGYDQPRSWVRLYHGSDTRADALLLGCACAALLGSGWRPRRGAGFGVLVLGALATLAWLATTATLPSPTLYRFGGLTLAAAATAVILVGLASDRLPALACGLSWAPLVYLGRISYGVYLWHHPIAWIPVPFLGPGLLARAGLTALRFVASIGIAAASYELVERRFLRLKGRFA